MGKMNYSGSIQYLEHVVVRISVEALGGIGRGDIHIELISPSATLSVLLKRRLLDRAEINGGQTAYVDWPFMSVMFWGEDPAGQWTLSIMSVNPYIDGVVNVASNCLFDNGGCEQICIDTYLSNECDCEVGYVLDYNGTSCSPEPVELAFTGDTPMVTGHNVSVQIYASPPRHLRCQLISRDAPGMPIRTAEEICSSGEVVFQNVPVGEHRVRVIAGNGDAVIRSHLILMPHSPFFCSLNAINRGITKDYYNGTAYYTIEWRAIGDDVGFLCDFGIPEYAAKCSSPYTFPATDGVTRVKVLPDPEKCRGMRSPYVFKLD
ncbi:Proprotein convertase subtilisin/kexin type 6 [Geodia barretti]|uniref:Proprotein convertase subtilisin/kexin type 6 n=1 Tax=Geodia barretti TaxID=519541 RepID=A0AA35RDE8_GEOBA|nr:Proprotein convertase subtilisin/kexin type 6 [Geodia barretti]